MILLLFNSDPPAVVPFPGLALAVLTEDSQTLTAASEDTLTLTVLNEDGS